MRQPALPNPRLAAPSRYLGHPEPGFFRLKLVRHGPWVPALIYLPCPMVPSVGGIGQAGPEQWCEPVCRSRTLEATIGDRAADPINVWERGYTIDPAEYLWRMALRDWASKYNPEAPEARPREPVRLSQMSPIF